ncbi:hypothetical protein [Paraburkholderia sp. MM6662-R1]|uniref:hypothetical protein n=1 Tax=Paraburkholderia sp. MM6662-R1 TaxID=2991066 RepID=UPI003D248A6F
MTDPSRPEPPGAIAWATQLPSGRLHAVRTSRESAERRTERWNARYPRPPLAVTVPLFPEAVPRMLLVGANQGHGHVRPRADGAKARCGGPALCPACQRELAAMPTLMTFEQWWDRSTGSFPTGYHSWEATCRQAWYAALASRGITP